MSQCKIVVAANDISETLLATEILQTAFDRTP